MRRAKHDSNHSYITKILQRLGFSVQNTAGVGAGFPDLVVGKAGRNYLVEIKTEHGSLEPSQTAFARDWNGGKVTVLRTIDDCIEFNNKVQSGTIK